MLPCVCRALVLYAVVLLALDAVEAVAARWSYGEMKLGGMRRALTEHSRLPILWLL